MICSLTTQFYLVLLGFYPFFGPWWVLMLRSGLSLHYLLIADKRRPAVNNER